jgi:hypothetical protein
MSMPVGAVLLLVTAFLKIRHEICGAPDAPQTLSTAS